MAKCIIHAGMHKTGSSSIQQSLKELDDGTFLYAQIGGKGNHSVPFIRMFSATPENYRFHRKSGRRAEKIGKMARFAQRKLRIAIADAGDRTLIVSGEGISLFSAEEVVAVRDFFAGEDCSVEAVAYVRPPGAFMSSSMQQRLNEDAEGDIDVAKFYPHYRARFEKFDAAFGADHVRFLKFVPKELKNQDVVADFCQHLGIDPAHIVNSKKNESRPKAVLYSLFQYRRMRHELGLPPLPGRKGALAILADLDATKFRISPDLVRPVLAANAADIAWMEQRLGQSLAEDLGHEQPGDYRSMADLLAPVPGVRERLLEALSAVGADASHVQSLSDYELMSLWSERQDAASRD